VGALLDAKEWGSKMAASRLGFNGDFSVQNMPIHIMDFEFPLATWTT